MGDKVPLAHNPNVERVCLLDSMFNIVFFSFCTLHHSSMIILINSHLYHFTTFFRCTIVNSFLSQHFVLSFAYRSLSFFAFCHSQRFFF